MTNYLNMMVTILNYANATDTNPRAYIHPVDIIPSDDKKPMIPDDLPLLEGKLVCSTCHDMYLQCQDDDQTEALNRRFLRGAPYMKRTALCFRCHDEKKYARLDPHNQILGGRDHQS